MLVTAPKNYSNSPGTVTIMGGLFGIFFQLLAQAAHVKVHCRVNVSSM